MKTRDIVENAILLPTSNLKADHPDHEVDMAKSDLYRAAKSALDLHKMLKTVSEEQGLEGWVQAKITKAADYLDIVHHYLDYQLRAKQGELDEQLPGSTTTAPAAAPGVAAPAGTVVQANPQAAAAAAAKAAQQRKKALQDAIRAKQKELSDLQRQLSAPVTVSETASAGASAAGGIATALGGNGFANGGPGTLKRAKNTTKEAAAPNQLKGTDKPKKMQKPGVIDQPHPFKGKLVGGD